MAAERGREEPGQFDPQKRGVCAAQRERAKREIAARKTNCLMLKAGQFSPVTGTNSHGLSASGSKDPQAKERD